MKIICAPDSFKGCLSAMEVARAMQRGIHRQLPEAVIDCCPVGDGGEGTACVIAAATGAVRKSVSVTGPSGKPTNAGFHLIGQKRIALLDMASAAGLTLVAPERRNVMRASTYGVGELILDAIAAGAARLIVAVGGSAGNDGGCGMAQALGARFLDRNGKVLPAPIGGGSLLSIAAVDSSNVEPSVRAAEITVACDVENPLTGERGAARVFAAQKGADAAQIDVLDAGLSNLAAVIRRDLGIEIERLPRAGAAGGLAAGLLVFAGATLASGIDLVLDAINFNQRVQGSDLCLTGEGRLDAQSLSGKACLGVARRAAASGVPTIALVGSLGEGAERSLDAGLAGYEPISAGLSEEESMRRAAEFIEATAARIAKSFFRNE